LKIVKGVPSSGDEKAQESNSEDAEHDGVVAGEPAANGLGAGLGARSRRGDEEEGGAIVVDDDPTLTNVVLLDEGRETTSGRCAGRPSPAARRTVAVLTMPPLPPDPLCGAETGATSALAAADGDGFPAPAPTHGATTRGATAIRWAFGDPEHGARNGEGQQLPPVAALIGPRRASAAVTARVLLGSGHPLRDYAALVLSEAGGPDVLFDPGEMRTMAAAAVRGFLHQEVDDRMGGGGRNVKWRWLAHSALAPIVASAWQDMLLLQLGFMGFEPASPGDRAQDGDVVVLTPSDGLLVLHRDRRTLGAGCGPACEWDDGYRADFVRLPSDQVDGSAPAIVLDPPEDCEDTGSWAPRLFDAGVSASKRGARFVRGTGPDGVVRWAVW
jgi:hypothetical protein